MKLTAGELSATHLGSTITVTTGSTTINGALVRIDAEAQLIDDRIVLEPNPRWVLGSSSVRLTIMPDLTVDLTLSHLVEITA